MAGLSLCGALNLGLGPRRAGTVAPVTTPLVIPMSGSRKSALIEPSRSALIIIDMQNYFLHPSLSPRATGGRAIVNATVNMVEGFKAAGMKTLWTFWGLDDFDLLTIPPAFKAGFAKNHSNLADESFGSDLGNISVSATDESQPCTGGSCRTQAAGRLLSRGAWNSQPWGPLNDLKNQGLADGSAFYFNKNRLSGLWGAQTPLGLWLQENGITTLFFGGVNSDQCKSTARTADYPYLGVCSRVSQFAGVWSTFIDAYFKGYDVVWVDDIAATVSPFYATQMVRYNADIDGFVSNSTMILPALKGNA